MVIIHDLRPITPRSNGTRLESAIKHIARHHSATTTGDWHTFWKYWNGTKGWGTGGYHELILRDGSVQLCYDPNEITNGVGGHNSTTYNICVVGNGSFTDAQERTWEERALINLKRFGLSPDDVKGHREFSGANTACPGIDMGMVRNRLKYLQKPVITEVSNKTEVKNVEKLTAAEQKVVNEAVRLKLIDGKEPFGEVSRIYLYAVLIGLAKRLEKVEAELAKK